MRSAATFFLIGQVIFGSCAIAQQTPNHVFQTTESIRGLLEDLNEVNFSQVPDDPPAVKNALPRHVLQLAREVWRQTQLLRFMNGLPATSQDPFPAREITPADVKETVDQIHLQISEILPAYGLEFGNEEYPLPEDKTPVDVYTNLLHVSAELDTLGIPATVPNDVYQLAQTLLHDVSDLAAQFDVASADSIAASVPVQSGKVPSDAYQIAVALLQDLARLAESDDAFAIKGGVHAPTEKPKRVTPREVILVLGRARADVNSMRVANGSVTESQTAPYSGGQTPSDVVRSIMQARAIIAEIARNSSS